METIGRVWNAENLRSGAELACEAFETVITNILQEHTYEPEIAQIVCHAVGTSGIEEICDHYWDLAIGQRIGEDASVSLIPGLECREYNDYYRGGGGGGGGGGRGGGGGGGDYFSSYFGGDVNSTNAYDWYPAVVEVEHEAMAEAKDLYDFCSGQGIEKINNILFAVMDWLGPSVLNSLYQHQLDPYSICSVGRYIMTLSPTEYTEGLYEVAKYPLADILEYLRHHDICDKSDNIGIELLKDILVEFSGTNEDEFCEFISEKHTREEYLEKAATILANTLLTYFEEERCNNFLSIIAPLDEEGLHVQYIGFDLSEPSERIDFCQQVINAFSPTSTYVPTPYRFPADLDISDWEPFSTPGEFLPGLTLIDMLEIEGATWRAETIIEGVGIYCTVFEEFIAQFVEEDVFDVASLCDLVKSGNLEALEGKCQALLVPSYSYSERPIGLKPFNVIPVSIYFGRQLTGISDISKDEICPAIDDVFNNLSLKDIFTEGLVVYIAEILPSLHSVCQNWEETVCFWKPYCPEPEFDSNRVLPTTTENPFYRFYHYVPSQEEVERANAEFDEILSGLLSLVLITADSPDRENLCEVVAGGINPASGRAVSEVVEELRIRVLGLLTDVQRCSQFVDTALGLIREPDVEQILTGGNQNLVYQLTGFSTSQAFCEALADDFSVGTPVSPGVTESSKPVATYNIFVKIVVYLKDNVPFPFPF